MVSIANKSAFGRWATKAVLQSVLSPMDWVARQRANELALSEDELVIARKELDTLRDQVYVLRCAIADVEADLDPSVDPTTRDFKAALKWLLQAANHWPKISCIRVRVERRNE